MMFARFCLAVLFVGLVGFAHSQTPPIQFVAMMNDKSGDPQESIPMTNAGVCTPSSGYRTGNYVKFTRISDTSGSLSYACSDSACTSGCTTISVSNGVTKIYDSFFEYTITVYWGRALYDFTTEQFQAVIYRSSSCSASGDESLPFTDVGKCTANSGYYLGNYAIFNTLSGNLGFISYGCSDSTCRSGCKTFAVSNGVCRTNDYFFNYKISVTWTFNMVPLPSVPTIPPPPVVPAPGPSLSFFSYEYYFGQDQCASSPFDSKTQLIIGNCIPETNFLGSYFKWTPVTATSGTLTYGCFENTCTGTFCKTVTIYADYCNPVSQLNNIKIYWGPNQKPTIPPPPAVPTGGPNPPVVPTGGPNIPPPPYIPPPQSTGNPNIPPPPNVPPPPFLPPPPGNPQPPGNPPPGNPQPPGSVTANPANAIAASLACIAAALFAVLAL